MLAGRRQAGWCLQQKEPRPPTHGHGHREPEPTPFERRHHPNPRRPSLPIRTRGSLIAARHSCATRELDGAPDGSDPASSFQRFQHPVTLRMASSPLSALHAFAVGGVASRGSRVMAIGADAFGTGAHLSATALMMGRWGKSLVAGLVFALV
jgi:hypothetical protein